MEDVGPAEAIGIYGHVPNLTDVESGLLKLTIFFTTFSAIGRYVPLGRKTVRGIIQGGTSLTVFHSNVILVYVTDSIVFSHLECFRLLPVSTPGSQER